MTPFILSIHHGAPDAYSETQIRLKRVKESDLEIAARDPLRHLIPLILSARVQHTPYVVCQLIPGP